MRREKSKKGYKIYYFGKPGYSIASTIQFTPKELDISKNIITPAKIETLLQDGCPPLYEQANIVLTDPAVVIPGTSNQYKFNEKPGTECPPADNKELEADLAIWCLPSTIETVFELSCTGPASKRAELAKLKKQDFIFLNKRKILSKQRISRTETFFTCTSRNSNSQAAGKAPARTQGIRAGGAYHISEAHHDHR